MLRIYLRRLDCDRHVIVVRVVYVNLLLNRCSPVPFLVAIRCIRATSIVPINLGEVLECDKFTTASIMLFHSFICS